MKIRLWQIDVSKSTNRANAHVLIFLNMKGLVDTLGQQQPVKAIYKKVYDGEVNCDDLEQIFTMFNVGAPPGYAGRSMSVSDVVEVVASDTVKPGTYFCDSIGFWPVRWDEKA